MYQYVYLFQHIKTSYCEVKNDVQFLKMNLSPIYDCKMKEPEIPAPSMNSNHDKPTGTVTVEVSGKKSSLSTLTKRDERDRGKSNRHLM